MVEDGDVAVASGSIAEEEAGVAQEDAYGGGVEVCGECGADNVAETAAAVAVASGSGGADVADRSATATIGFVGAGSVDLKEAHAVPPVGVIDVGCVVRLEGLQQAAHLNGRHGVVLRSDPAGSGRWEVGVETGDGPTQVKALKPENLAWVANAVRGGDGELRAGCVVRIDGLQKATHLNGRQGTILQPDPSGMGRWEVKLLDAEGRIEVKAIKSDNLVLENAGNSQSRAVVENENESDVDEIAPGRVVSIQGLEKAAHLNGLRGTVLQQDPAGTGRWEVEVLVSDESRREVKALRAENLVLEQADIDDYPSVSEAEDDDDIELEMEEGDGDGACTRTADVDPFAGLDVNELAAQAMQSELDGDTSRAATLSAAIDARRRQLSVDIAGAGDVRSASAAGAVIVERVEVPAENVGRVIGAGGETIRKLSDDSGACLNFLGDDVGARSDIRILTVRGFATSVAKAKRLVKEILTGDGTARNDDTSDGAGGRAGFAGGVCKWYAAGFCRNRPDESGGCRNGLHCSAAARKAEAGWLALCPQTGSTTAGSGPLLLLLDLEGGGNQDGRDGEDEIIEVPVVALCQQSGQELGRFHRFVRPGYWDREAQSMRERFKPSCFNGESTAEPFAAVIASLLAWIASLLGKTRDTLSNESFLFVTCGNWDVKTALPRQSAMPGGVDLPTQELLFSRWCNLKEAFRDHYKLSQNAAPTGMRGMLKRLKIPLSGQHHLGMDDVTNLLKILSQMISEGANIQPTGKATNLRAGRFGGGSGGKGKRGGGGKGKCGKGKGGKGDNDRRGGKRGKWGGGCNGVGGLQTLPSTPPQMSPPQGAPPQTVLPETAPLLMPPMMMPPPMGPPQMVPPHIASSSISPPLMVPPQMVPPDFPPPPQTNIAAAWMRSTAERMTDDSSNSACNAEVPVSTDGEAVTAGTRNKRAAPPSDESAEEDDEEEAPRELPKANIGMWGLPVDPLRGVQGRAHSAAFRLHGVGGVASGVISENGEDKDDSKDMRTFLQRMPVPGEDSWEEGYDEDKSTPGGRISKSARTRGADLGILAGVLAGSGPATTPVGTEGDSEEPPKKVLKISSLLASLPAPKMSVGVG
eukprot:TRINITY_DN42921_c0_g1_i1.p1 TRINITY_DN42921_c0_g1~~TRINITY_DN42921_c0_g1_i1.p1  ORF type:complete len:1238 (-),score=262.82 TRINITY_DN42921_c0_g1_i1:164-3442(-)